jgi:N-acyl-D-aspartate/D-glutamate deacylase
MAMLDLLLKNGILIDGTGTPGSRADVGIRNGRIATVGATDEFAARTLDLDGLVICPGFVDPHTHYDAQLFWDPFATPSNLHGVTTVIGGNCGFTLAPLAPDGADYTRRMMANVEGMPLETLERGLDWEWSSFGDYLGRLDGRLGLNAAFLVGHSAIRRLVMGRDATGNPASAEQIDRMKALLAESLRAGGLGFSSSQAHTHRDGDGEFVASRFASRDEMLALAGTCRDFPGTTLEIIVDGCLGRFSDPEVDLMIEMSRAADRPINWNVMGVSENERDRHEHQLTAGTRARERGARIVALTMPTIGGLKMSFLTYCALHLIPGWEAVMRLPVPERVAKMKDPAVRATMDAQARDPKAGVLTALSRWGQYVIGDTYAEENQGLYGRTVAEIAKERRQPPLDTLFDIVVADDLRTDLWPIPPDDDAASWQRRIEVWRDDRALIGGSDAGAHLDRMCGGRYPTAFLGEICRDRGMFPMSEAIHLMTERPARLFGLKERGRVAPGFHADLVVFDPRTIAAGPVKNRRDLPGGCERLFSAAEGVQHVFVNGIEIVREGRETGTLPGRLLRSGKDTETVSATSR